MVGNMTEDVFIYLTKQRYGTNFTLIEMKKMYIHYVVSHDKLNTYKLRQIKKFKKT